MDYKQLQFFLAVCEAQSFRNAAARCYVSQQAISKSLSNLEQELGVQLFVRNQNGVSLTEAGQQLEKLARPHLKSSYITTVIPIPNTAAVIVITTVTLSSQLHP